MRISNRLATTKSRVTPRQSFDLLSKEGFLYPTMMLRRTDNSLTRFCRCGQTRDLFFVRECVHYQCSISWHLALNSSIGIHLSRSRMLSSSCLLYVERWTIWRKKMFHDTLKIWLRRDLCLNQQITCLRCTKKQAIQPYILIVVD